MISLGTASTAAKLDPEILRIVKAASLVEHNGAAYAHHLCRIFADDPVFQETARRWGEEEIQHGEALARWAWLADPRIRLSPRRLPASRPAFRSISTATARAAARSPARWWRAASSRPAPALITPRCARRRPSRYCRKSAAISRPTSCATTGCSTGTSSAGSNERIGLGAARVALGRIAESEDDEFAYAYYAANEGELPYDRRRYSRAYARRAFPLYRGPMSSAPSR